MLRAPSRPSLPTGDIDLLAAKADLPVLAAQLEDLGFRREPQSGTPDVFFLALDSATGHLIQLHITTEVSFGPLLVYQTDAGSACLAARERRAEAWWLHPGDAFWVMLLHCLLDKGSIDERHRAQLIALAEAALPDSDVKEAVGRVAVPRTDELLALVATARWPLVLGIGEALRCAWRHDNRGRFVRTRICHVGRLLRHPSARWHRRGIAVALLGPDGAGKSTLATAIEQTFAFPTRTLYMDVRADALRPFTRLHVPGLTFVAYLTVLWSRLLRARYHQLRGRLVIFDRYNYDAHLSPRPKSWLMRLARTVHAHALPPATLALILDAPGEVMYARKGERSVEDLEDERQRLLALGRARREMHVLNAADGLEAVRLAAIAQIWRCYSDRWENAQGQEAAS